ncbi:MAG: hypothetical protein K0S41_2812 [Anaerocolumna sp.]|jgi:hypothetical protein|nr:hypothetical protein [Anaerocolumna sp.]
MKKINSIGYGGKVISIIILCTFIIPIVLYIVPFQWDLLKLVSKISFLVGILVLFLFFILLKIELHQDKKINEYFKNNKNKKLSIGDGKFECQACGNRQVKLTDKRCSVCGIRFI